MDNEKLKELSQELIGTNDNPDWIEDLLPNQCEILDSIAMLCSTCSWWHYPSACQIEDDVTCDQCYSEAL